MAVQSFFKDFDDLQLDGVEPTGVQLGRGSFGLVFEVKRHGEVLAAKKLHDFFFEADAPLSYSSKRTSEFMDECRSWATFKHPNMVEFRGLYRDFSSNGTPVIHIVMEKMDISLGDYLIQNSRESVPLHKKVCVLLQVAQGLNYLHSQTPPLVHHDLKPDNVLLNTKTFTAKLSDFGMIRSIFRSNLTRMSSVKGTPVFMPPEAQTEPPRYDEKLDVFSYGCVIISVVLHSKAPLPTGPTAMIDGQLKAVGEYDRRKHYIEQFTAMEKRVFQRTVENCLKFHPEQRPSSSALVQEMTLIVAQPCITLDDPLQYQQENEAMIANLQAQKEALSTECLHLETMLSNSASNLRHSQAAMDQQMGMLQAFSDNCAEASDLPEGWTATFAPNGRIVYASHREKKTQWTHPRTGKPSLAPTTARRRVLEPTQFERSPSSDDKRPSSLPTSVPTHMQPSLPARPRPAPPPHWTHPPQPHPAPPPQHYPGRPPSLRHGPFFPTAGVPNSQYYMSPSHQGVGYGSRYHDNHRYPMGHREQMPYSTMRNVPVSMAAGNSEGGYEGDPPLPHGWEMWLTEDGQRYYANPHTGETSWDRPASGSGHS